MPSPTTASSEAAAAELDQAVRDRYSEGAGQAVPELCCPVDYDTETLAVIPQEVIERDYGCGNPSKHLRAGETVLDLGSGTGKICFIASQIVGAEGRVIGVDMNDDMLEVARRNAPVVGERIGYDNVTFFKGRIEELDLDRDVLAAWLADNPVRSEADFAKLEQHVERLRGDAPMIATNSIDVVVSNCVLNLVMPDKKRKLFEEIFRVLRKGGRAVISDIVSDEDVPLEMVNDPELWSGCISGAFREDAFLKAFEDAGFHGVEILERGGEPWHVVNGIEFRSLTVQAYKGKQGPCMEHRQAVIYKGPWSAVIDDDGHTLARGQRMAVCEKTYGLMTDPEGPYAGQIIGVQPREAVAPEHALPFACTGDRIRTPKETKGADYVETSAPAEDCCEPGACC